MDLGHPTNLTMYQHPSVVRMEHSDNSNSSHGSFMQKSHYDNITTQQQQYSQLPLRKEVDEEGRICAVVLPKSNTHPIIEENNTSPLPTEESKPNLHTDESINGLLQLSLEKVKNEIEDDINSFMESAHDVFLKVSSKEMKIQQAADLLGRPYSFVYSRYQEWCDTITGKITTKKKEGKKGKKKKKRKAKKITLSKSSRSGKTFQCEDCPARFHTEATRKSHSKVHLEDHESHLCTSCGIVFPKLSQLMKHRIEAHEDALQCPHCDKQYTVITSYQAHIKTAHSKVRPFNCDECGKGFFSRVKLEDHYHIHTGYKPFMCGYCEKCFTSLSNLNHHHKTVHHGEHGTGKPREKNHECEECGKAYYSSYKLREHMSIHTGEKPFACDLCDFKCRLKANLKRHGMMHRGEKQKRKSVKDMQKNFACQECGLKFITNFKLGLHMHTHTGAKPYTCDLCDARFNQKANLTRHKMVKHTNEKPFKCNFCPAAYACKVDLKRHSMVHTGYKPFKCDLCEYRCVKKHSLEHHVNSTHTGKTPFKCDFYGCSAEYTSRSSLYQHKLKHLPPPVKTCNVCNEKFPDSNSLNRHMMIHPGNEPLSCNQCDKIFYNQGSLNRHAYVHMYKADGGKPKTTKPRKKNPNPKPKAATTQKKFATQFVEAPVAVENGHISTNSSVSQSWTINAENMNTQVTQHSFHHAFPANQISQQISQFTNLNAWPSTIDPDELRHRLLSSFK